ncbi:MAG TPA: hypothetical protein VM049_08980, partial [Gaiellaceae bacterium]|nr:hypothetical protein [Gaiellaceae bacterium]
MTVDGDLAEAAWNVTSYNVNFGGLGSATVRYLRNDNNLYIGVVVKGGASQVTPQLQVYFDEDHDGIADSGDDAWFVGLGASSGQDYHYNGDGGYTSDTGNATEGAGTTASGDAVFELRHPLCEDSSGDICAGFGDEPPLGIDFRYVVGGDSSVSAPGPDRFDPKTNWADLTLQDVDDTAPTV